MSDFYKTEYGKAWSDVYDDWRAAPDVDSMVAKLTSLAQRGSALELGVGTGRVALPLAANGVDVTGVDVSEEMLDCLRAKDPGQQVTTVNADIADFALGREFNLVYIVQHTLYCLEEQALQQSCLGAARRHLREGGRVVVEGSIVATDSWRDGQLVKVLDVGDESVTLRVGLYNATSQVATTQHVHIDRGGITLRPLRLRYCTVPELDLMAANVGLTLVSRNSGWEGERFDDKSRKHISVYRPED